MNNVRTQGLRWPLPALLGLLLAACAAPPVGNVDQGAADASACLQLLGEVRWPRDTQYAGTTVGGLSSIDYDARSGLYYLVSDDRSAFDPARLYTARIRYDASGLHEVVLQDRIWLLNARQQRFASINAPEPGVAVPDPEALRLLSTGDDHGQTMLWSSEGDFKRGFGPQLIEAGTDGRWLREWPLPPQLALPAPPDRATQGPRNNLTLEGMSLSADGKTLWLSMEGALKQDGPMPGPGRPGAPVRLTAYDTAARQPLRQLAYVPDALPQDLGPMSQHAVNGVSSILADGPDHLLVLERSYAPARGFGARIYRIRTDSEAGTDTLPQQQLTPDNHRPVDKTLLLDLARAGLKTVDNLEGMSWGPPLASGERVLLLVSDNNFNPAEVTQFAALRERAGGCGRGL
ncbi:3-phytase [Comamonas phosphati]|nr:3-phytase [Comamonas phosphati]